MTTHLQATALAVVGLAVATLLGGCGNSVADWSRGAETYLPSQVGSSAVVNSPQSQDELARLNALSGGATAGVAGETRMDGGSTANLFVLTGPRNALNSVIWATAKQLGSSGGGGTTSGTATGQPAFFAAQIEVAGQQVHMLGQKTQQGQLTNQWLFAVPSPDHLLAVHVPTGDEKAAKSLFADLVNKAKS